MTKHSKRLAAKTHARHHKHPWANQRRVFYLIAAAVVTGAIGVALLRGSHADTYLIRQEAELGTITGNATKAGGLASGDSFVHFGTEAAVVTCDQAGIQKLVDDVSTQKIEANLRELVQDDSKPKPNELISRHVSQPGNQIKVDWAKQQLASYGLQVIDQSAKDGSWTVNNALGRLAGSNPNTIYLVGGHIDSINTQNGNDASKAAPGANDDGTGVVAAMEAGRVMKAFQPCMKASVDFMGFNDEEENSVGADAYVKSVAGKSFKGAYNIDMIGYVPDKVCYIHRYDNSTRDKPLVDKLTQVNSKYGINLNMSSALYHEDDTDTWNFWNAKLPAVYSNECTPDDNYPGYHSPNDKTSYVNFDAVAQVTKLMVAALAELSMQ